MSLLVCNLQFPTHYFPVQKSSLESFLARQCWVKYLISPKPCSRPPVCQDSKPCRASGNIMNISIFYACRSTEVSHRLCFYLFLVGLELDLTVLKANFLRSTVIAVGAMGGTFAVAFGPIYWMFSVMPQPTTNFTPFLLFTGVAIGSTGTWDDEWRCFPSLYQAQIYSL